jgi:hypothetical protein
MFYVIMKGSLGVIDKDIRQRTPDTTHPRDIPTGFCRVQEHCHALLSIQREFRWRNISVLVNVVHLYWIPLPEYQ